VKSLPHCHFWSKRILIHGWMWIKELQKTRE
jgi:hypothetical protein